MGMEVYVIPTLNSLHNNIRILYTEARIITSEPNSLTGRERARAHRTKFQESVNGNLT